MKPRLQSSYGCAVELALDVLGGKWKAVILAHLKDSPLRYGELRKRIAKMSEKMLTQRLAELMDLGFVERRAGNGSVLYDLTEEGRRLLPVLEALNAWGLSIARGNDVHLDYERE